MSTFSISYPNAYLFICLIIGLLFALALYFREDKFKEHPAFYKYLLAFLRFSLVSILCFLLLEPIIRFFDEKQEDPIIAVFQDVSTSVTESNTIKSEEYADNINNICNILNNEYEVDRYNFGHDINNGILDSCVQKSTNFSSVFSFIEENYANQNLGAIILYSDGIYNMGRNPLYENYNISAPLYSIALGDTTVQRDIIIKQTYYNKIAYLGDKQKMQVDIQAFNCSAQNTKVDLYQKVGSTYKQIDSKPLRITNSSFFQTIEFELNHLKAGTDIYQIRINSIGGELSTQNNIRQLYVDVIDSKQNILVLANAPHPDLAVLKRIFDKQRNFEVRLNYAKDPVPDIKQYDLVIFHNLPSANFPINNVLKKCKEDNKPTFFIVGAQTNLAVLNQYQDVLKIRGNNRSLNEVQPLVSDDFSLFLLAENYTAQIENFPPAFAPFGSYDLNPNAQVLLYQKIGNINTDYPLIAFNSVGRKTAVLAAEGIWKWRLFNQLQFGSTTTCDQTILKSVQYLTLKEDKRKFRVSSSSNVYPETESILLLAELYNNVYERVNEPDVFLKLSNESGEQFDYSFSKRDKSYELNLGVLAPGEYSYTASTILKGQKYEDSGEFIIQDIQLESYNLQANHSFLRALSTKYNGDLIAFDSTAGLPSLLIDGQKLKPVIYQNASTKPLTHLKWLFWVLLALLSIEWFIRRFLGNY